MTAFFGAEVVGLQKVFYHSLSIKLQILVYENNKQKVASGLGLGQNKQKEHLGRKTRAWALGVCDGTPGSCSRSELLRLFP